MNKRPIDKVRDSGGSFTVGDESEGQNVRMISTDDVLYFVKEKAIYKLQMADQIDPERTNINVRNTVQKVLEFGTENPLVPKILLTADTLFNSRLLGESFNQAKGIDLSLELLKDLAAMFEIRDALRDGEEAAITEYNNRKQHGWTLQLPSVVNLDIRCDLFAQKCGHVYAALENIARLFYKNELSRKWVDSLDAHVNKTYGVDSDFSKFIKAAGPMILYAKEMRNLIEHPKENEYIKITDFRLDTAANVSPPTIDVVWHDTTSDHLPLLDFMTHIAEHLAEISEVLIAHLCSVTVKSFSAFPIQVGILPLEKRAHSGQRFHYVCNIGNEWVRLG